MGKVTVSPTFTGACMAKVFGGGDEWTIEIKIGQENIGSLLYRYVAW
jgi:hypothetical protein